MIQYCWVWKLYYETITINYGWVYGYLWIVFKHTYYHCPICSALTFDMILLSAYLYVWISDNQWRIFRMTWHEEFICQWDQAFTFRIVCMKCIVYNRNQQFRTVCAKCLECIIICMWIISFIMLFFIVCWIAYKNPSPLHCSLTVHQLHYPNRYIYCNLIYHVLY